jgi:hypothetical protein
MRTLPIKFPPHYRPYIARTTCGWRVLLLEHMFEQP